MGRKGESESGREKGRKWGEKGSKIERESVWGGRERELESEGCGKKWSESVETECGEKGKLKGWGERRSQRVGERERVGRERE